LNPVETAGCFTGRNDGLIIMRFFKTPAIVLRHYNSGEADKLLVLYSIKYGKIKAIAKGARKTRSKYGSSVEPFSHNELMLYKKEGKELYTITGCNTVQSHSNLREDINFFVTASYIAELVDKMTEENDAHPEIFLMLDEVLSAITEACREKAMLVFTVKLLLLSGYKLCLDRCACCGMIAKRVLERVKFSPVQGGIICPKCQLRDLDAKNILWQYVDYINKFENMAVSKIDSIELSLLHKKELSDIIHSYLFCHISGELKTNKFIRQWQKNKAVVPSSSISVYT